MAGDQDVKSVKKLLDLESYYIFDILDATFLAISQKCCEWAYLFVTNMAKETIQLDIADLDTTHLFIFESSKGLNRISLKGND